MTTESVFRMTLATTHPKNVLEVYYCPITKEKTIFSLPPSGVYTGYTYMQKYKVAIHVWEGDQILKDTDLTFTPIFTASSIQFITPAGSPYSYSFGSVNSIYTLPQVTSVNGVTGSVKDIPAKLNKCECGAHSIGSNQHSSYCPIKGEANV